jgi:hypothetical protein
MTSYDLCNSITAKKEAFIVFAVRDERNQRVNFHFNDAFVLGGLFLYTDGRLYTATPVDPVVLLLSIFDETRMKVLSNL